MWLVLGLASFALADTSRGRVARAADHCAWPTRWSMASSSRSSPARDRRFSPRRHRRDLPPLPRSFSFPSGHAASTFGGGGRGLADVARRALCGGPSRCLIGYSRIYLGHHYPLDVVGGALVGMPRVLGTRWPSPLHLREHAARTLASRPRGASITGRTSYALHCGHGTCAPVPPLCDVAVHRTGRPDRTCRTRLIYSDVLHLPEGRVAQLVEHTTENRSVDSSILSPATR